MYLNVVESLMSKDCNLTLYISQPIDGYMSYLLEFIMRFLKTIWTGLLTSLCAEGSLHVAYLLCAWKISVPSSNMFVARKL